MKKRRIAIYDTEIRRYIDEISVCATTVFDASEISGCFCEYTSGGRFDLRGKHVHLMNDDDLPIQMLDMASGTPSSIEAPLTDALFFTLMREAE